MKNNNNLLEQTTMRSLAVKWNEMIDEGRDNVDRTSITKDEIRNEYDGDIWTYVDSHEGTSFDAVLGDLVNEVEELASQL